ncbi:hypothetical protein [Psychrobacter sp. AT9]|uniref:hypothetical protein n=1 Tax=Psychrobacter sp. AT9 TaxID=3242893 RepID=UPI0039A64C67
MTIQIPNPGTGNGATGDNEFVLWSKVKDNFGNSSHAASRLVGTQNSNVPEFTSSSGVSGLGYAGVMATFSGNTDNPTLNQVPSFTGMPSGFYYFTGSAAGGASGKFCMHAAFGATNSSGFRLLNDFYSNRYYYQAANNATGDSWRTPVEAYHSNATIMYTTTTAAGANVVVSSTGQLMRSTSSERYKDILAKVELDDARYADAMALKPIVYRSTANADNPDYHYYSFSAEELGAYDPAFTLWRDTETVTDDEGNTTEQPLAERVADGINLNAIVAFLHATNIKQGKLIAEQAEAIVTLTKRIDDITVE